MTAVVLVIWLVGAAVTKYTLEQMAFLAPVAVVVVGATTATGARKAICSSVYFVARRRARSRERRQSAGPSVASSLVEYWCLPCPRAEAQLHLPNHYVLEFLGYRFAFGSDDFRYDVTAAAGEARSGRRHVRRGRGPRSRESHRGAPSPLGRYLMRHCWEHLSLNDGESLVYWLRKLVFRGAYRVKEDLLEVTFDEATGDFGYTEPEGGRALLELRTHAQLALAPSSACRAMRTAPAAPEASPTTPASCPTTRRGRRCEPEPLLVLDGSDPDLPDRAERHDQLLRLTRRAMRAQRDEAETGGRRDRGQAVKQPGSQLHAHIRPVEPIAELLAIRSLDSSAAGRKMPELRHG